MPAKKQPARQPSAEMPSEDKLIGTAEAAEQYNLSLESIRRYVRQGKVTAYQIPGNRGAFRIVKAELEELMRPKKYQPADPLSD